MPGSRVLALSIPQQAVMLDTTRPAGNLLKAGRLVVLATRAPTGTARGNGFGCDSAASLSGDGTALVCFGQLDAVPNPDNYLPVELGSAPGSNNVPVSVANAIGRFSATTGKLLSLTVLPGPYKEPRLGRPGLGGVAWSDPAGDVLITSQTNGQGNLSLSTKLRTAHTLSTSQASGQPGLPLNTKLRTTMVVVSQGATRAIPGPAWAAASPEFTPGFLGAGW